MFIHVYSNFLLSVCIHMHVNYIYQQYFFPKVNVFLGKAQTPLRGGTSLANNWVQFIRN